jgi:hypothetical protein
MGKFKEFFKEQYQTTTVQDIIDNLKEEQDDEWFDEDNGIEEFIQNVSESELEEAFPNIYSDYFGDPSKYKGTVYHHTTEDNKQSILTQGIQPSDITRGISNRSTGSATFTSAEIDESESYGNVIFEIDLEKAIEINPDITTGLEPPIEDSIRRKNLANILEVEDQGQFEPDSSDGLREDTLVVYGHIPREAIELLEF